MPTRLSEPLDMIGKRLRDEWRELVKSPLPERLGRLLDELERAEKASIRQPQPHKRVH